MAQDLAVGCGAQGMGNLVVIDGPVDVIRPVPESQLGDLGCNHDPEGLDVGEIVQEQTGDRNFPEILLSRRHRDMLELGRGRIEGQGHKTLKPFGLILQLADMEKMFDLFLYRLDMPVEHGRVRLEPRTVDLPGDLKPPFVIQFRPEELLMDSITEDLGSTAWTTGESCSLEIFEDIGERLPCDPGDLGQLNHRKGLDLRVWTSRPDCGEQVQIVLVREFGIDARHHVDLPDRLMTVRIEAGEDIARSQHVAPGVPRLGIEGAEFAELIANVGIVDMEVPDIIGGVTAHALPDVVGQSPHGGKVRGLVEPQAILIGKPLPFLDFPVYIRQPGPGEGPNQWPNSIGANNYKADVKMTLTAPGCGMGPVLAPDVQNKLISLDPIDEANVELVWDPPWNQSMMTEAAKLQLGLM